MIIRGLELPCPPGQPALIGTCLEVILAVHHSKKLISAIPDVLERYNTILRGNEVNRFLLEFS